MARLAARVAGSRSVEVEAILVPPSLTDARTTFDDWYDARTIDADLVVYNGHAGLGSNVRALARKGTFRAQQYVVMAFNACDTLAYLDHGLADRRALLNPDDPSGTKYMDTIANVLGGYFTSGDATSLRLVRAFVAALTEAPQTYEEIFRGVDPTQLMVVTGEEDNAFQPAMMAPARSSTRHEADGVPAAPLADGVTRSGCNAGAGTNGPCAGAALALLAALYRRRATRSPAGTSSSTSRGRSAAACSR